MKETPHHLAALAVVLWVGSLWSIGYLAVPILFQVQPDRQLAGLLAGRMFEVAGYAGMVCGMYLLLYRWLQNATGFWQDRPTRIIVAMLLITFAIQFYIQPLMADLKSQAQPLEVMQSAFAGQFKTWHGVSSILYLLESLLGAALVIRTFRSK